MTTNNRKIKTVQFSLGANAFECQVKNWTMNNNTPSGERFYAQCPDGEFIEDAEPDWSFDLEFYADWRLNGVSDYLTSNDNATVTFVLKHHADLAGEGVQWSGSCKIAAPSVGGEVRTTEMTSVTLPCIGKPLYARL